MTNSLYAVQNDTGKPFVFRFGGAAQPNPSRSVPVFTNSAKPLLVALGNGSFAGNGSNQVLVPVLHSLALAPSWVDVMPALQSLGGGWVAEAFQYQAADASRFYMGFHIPDAGVTFGAGVTYFFNWLGLAQLP